LRDFNNNEETIENLARKIFPIGPSKDEVICPPDQVFLNPNFGFLLTLGGYVVDGDVEYQKLMTLIKELGEKEFFIMENLGATRTERNDPFRATIPVDKNLDYFKSLEKAFEPDFGFLPFSYFVFGKNTNWGIYVCEYPTINIIGCAKELAEEFSTVFGIDGNGFL